MSIYRQVVFPVLDTPIRPRLRAGCIMASGETGCTASTWMKLAGMDLTAEDVIDRGGINAAARGVKPESASEADLPGSVDRDLAEAEAEIATTKRAYYDALSRRNRALRALAREGGDE